MANSMRAQLGEIQVSLGSSNTDNTYSSRAKVDDIEAIVDAAALVSGNIKAGVTLFGVAGAHNVIDTTEAINPATAAMILNGKISFVNGLMITGTIYDYTTEQGTVSTIPISYARATGPLGTRIELIPRLGYYDSSSRINISEPNFIAANIKSGVTMFGVLGTYTGV